MERFKSKIKLKFIPFSYSGALFLLLGSIFTLRARRCILWISWSDCGVQLRIWHKAEEPSELESTTVLIGTVSKAEVYGLQWAISCYAFWAWSTVHLVSKELCWSEASFQGKSSNTLQMANGGTWKDKVHRAQNTRAQMEGSGGAHGVYGKDREAPDLQTP